MVPNLTQSNGQGPHIVALWGLPFPASLACFLLLSPFSLGSSHPGFLIFFFYLTCQTHCCPWAFALMVSSAWIAFPGEQLDSFFHFQLIFIQRPPSQWAFPLHTFSNVPLPSFLTPHIYLSLCDAFFFLFSTFHPLRYHNLYFIVHHLH